MDRAYGYNRDVLHGIQASMATESSWTVHHATAHPRELPALREWEPDGVIAHVRIQRLPWDWRHGAGRW